MAPIPALLWAATGLCAPSLGHILLWWIRTWTALVRLPGHSGELGWGIIGNGQYWDFIVFATSSCDGYGGGDCPGQYIAWWNASRRRVVVWWRNTFEYNLRNQRVGIHEQLWRILNNTWNFWEQIIGWNSSYCRDGTLSGRDSNTSCYLIWWDFINSLKSHLLGAWAPYADIQN